MRIVTRLNASAAIAGLALAILLPISIWAGLEFRESKADYLISGEIHESISHAEELRNQYYLYREDRTRQLWDRSKDRTSRLLLKAVAHFGDRRGIKLLLELQKNTEERSAIFQRAVKNSEALRLSGDDERSVYAEVDKRLFSQLILKAVEFRNMATDLEQLSTARVERAYEFLIVSYGLVFCLLGLAVLVGQQLARILSKGLVPLRLGMENVAGGDLEFLVKAEGADEFVELSRSFNSMTDQLKQASTGLREAIDRLEKINSRVPGIVIIQFRKHADGKFSIPYASQAMADIFHVNLEAVREDAAA